MKVPCQAGGEGLVEAEEEAKDIPGDFELVEAIMHQIAQMSAQPVRYNDSDGTLK